MCFNSISGFASKKIRHFDKSCQIETKHIQKCSNLKKMSNSKFKRQICILTAFTQVLYDKALAFFPNKNTEKKQERNDLSGVFFHKLLQNDGEK